jgi:ribonucleoside-diphosphate reductase alpha chain
MKVIKRNGKSEEVRFDLITDRIKTLLQPDLNIDPIPIAQKVTSRLRDNMTTRELDDLSSQICMNLSEKNPEYGVLAARIAIDNHQKNTKYTMLQVVKKLYNNININGKHSPLVSKELYNIVQKNAEVLEQTIDYSRDFLFDYFGFCTLLKAYLLKIEDEVIERPQHLWMRVAIGLHSDNIPKVVETYKNMSRLLFTHATPTLFHAGTPRPQLASCFLLGTEDSVHGIYKTITDCAKISKWAGGIGCHISNIRAQNSYISSTGGKAGGILPMLKVYNYTAKYINQSGRRPGSFAMYLEPWHSDIFQFLDAKKNHGNEEEKARDLFYALWIPDAFMRAVEKNDDWYLMCPDQCPGLTNAYGKDFDNLYYKYVREGKYLKKVKARDDVWNSIISTQIESGLPYMLYKDACNQKSNQKNLGTIKSSNLCVAPETKILTDQGHVEIQTLKNKKIKVWNGTEYSEVIVKQTSEQSELITVSFSDGSELTCTKYHKFYIQDKYTPKNKDVIRYNLCQVYEAQNLKKDMKIIKCRYPIIDNNHDLELAYTNGFFSGDDTYLNANLHKKKCQFKSLPDKAYCKRHADYQKDDENSEYCNGISYSKKPHVSLYGEKIKLLEHLNDRSVGTEKDGKLNVCLTLHLKDKFFVPSNYSLKSKLEWFSGYCDADGTISNNGDNQSLQIACIHKQFLMEVKLMLQTCGISSKVTLNKTKKMSLLPDGKGSQKLYETQNLYRLLIGSNDLQQLCDLGFNPKRLVIHKRSPQRNAVQFVTIDDIKNVGRTDKTYCFNEKKRHAGIFNGVITGNCTEILEYSDHKEYAVCNLSSISLSKFVKYPKNPFQNKITIYTKQDCNWCLLLKGLLRERNILFTEVELKGDEIPTFFQKISRNTLPQLFDGDVLIGGYDSTFERLKPTYDFEELGKVTKIVTRNLNRTIDIGFYPVVETQRSNLRHRPIGIGVQGLADAFIQMRYPFDSEQARELNSQIFETIYYYSISESLQLSKEREGNMILLREMLIDENIEIPELYSLNFKHSNTELQSLYHELEPILKEIQRDKYYGSYSTFENSPLHAGKFQFDLWDDFTPGKYLPLKYDWGKLREEVMKYGTRNSLLLAPMPTASTSQILGNNECIEPYTSNMYTRRTMAGEFTIINKWLIRDLINIGIWNDEMSEKLMFYRGSVQKIREIPELFKKMYKTAWELKQKVLIDQSVDRGRFVDQSQSLNLFFAKPDFNVLSKCHFYGWKKGLKTGSYYIRSKPAMNAQSFTIDPKKAREFLRQEQEAEREKYRECLTCSS